MAILAETQDRDNWGCSESRKGTGKDKAKELRRRIDESLDTLAKAVDSVRASETFKAYLAVQARFHRYSWHNSLLILSQKPDATRVAGYRAWQKLKRQVRKGERGIMIFAPCPWSREREAESGETETESGIFFRAVHVFDVSQTDGPELPTVDVPTVDTAADGLLADLACVADKRGVKVTFKPIESGAFGSSKRGAVDISNEHATGQQAKTLAHELAHEALHWQERGPLGQHGRIPNEGIGIVARDARHESTRNQGMRSVSLDGLELSASPVDVAKGRWSMSDALIGLIFGVLQFTVFGVVGYLLRVDKK